jgi:hypothetical protein
MQLRASSSNGGNGSTDAVVGWISSLVWALMEPTFDAPDKTRRSCAETLRAAAVCCRVCGCKFMT